MKIPHITIQGFQRKSWRPRTRSRATFADVLEHVGRAAYRRLRLRLCFRNLDNFRQSVEFVVVEALHVAAQLLVSGEDIRGKTGYATVARVVESRIGTSHAAIAKQLRDAAPYVRKAILAAAFGWLRLQFPVLNAVSAVAASELIVKLLQSRNFNE
jgi:hypothetical protein